MNKDAFLHLRTLDLLLPRQFLAGVKYASPNYNCYALDAP